MTRGRKLGFWETVKVLTHDGFGGSDIVVIDLQLKGKLKVECLKQALEIGFNRHPLLRATIHQDQGLYCFNIDLNFHQIPFSIIQQTKTNEWHEIIEKELQQCFIKEESLWRVTLLQSVDEDNHFIVSFHHSICDGTSLFSFLDECLNYYDQLEQLKSPEQTFLSLQEPQEKHLLQKIDWNIFLENATRFQNIEKGWEFYKKFPIDHRKTKLLIKQLPISLINQLHTLCQQKAVSLNSCFNALALITKQQLDQQPYDGVVWSWVNTRGFCEPNVPNENFGYFVNALATKHNNINEGTNIWNLARDYHTQLKNRLPELAYFPEDLFDKDRVIAYYNMDKLIESDHFFYDFTLSYLDEIPLKKQYGSLEIMDMSLAVNINSGIAGMVLEIFKFSDHISFACCYAEPLLEKSWVEAFMEQFQKNIVELI